MSADTGSSVTISGDIAISDITTHSLGQSAFQVRNSDNFTIANNVSFTQLNSGILDVGVTKMYIDSVNFEGSQGQILSAESSELSLTNVVMKDQDGGDVSGTGVKCSMCDSVTILDSEFSGLSSGQTGGALFLYADTIII